MKEVQIQLIGGTISQRTFIRFKYRAAGERHINYVKGIKIFGHFPDEGIFKINFIQAIVPSLRNF